MLAILCFIALICIELGLEGLIFWGVGSFIVWAFGLGFTWTFWHGLAIAILVIVSKIIFGGYESDK